jgi:hypothetical protein
MKPSFPELPSEMMLYDLRFETSKPYDCTTLFVIQIGCMHCRRRTVGVWTAIAKGTSKTHILRSAPLL